jgi:hypothetical protein
LVKLIAGIPAKINLIPFNEWPGAPYERSDWARIERFADIIYKAGYASPIRTPRGEDIMAACGQLKSATERARKSRAQIAAETGLQPEHPSLPDVKKKRRPEAGPPSQYRLIRGGLVVVDRCCDQDQCQHGHEDPTSRAGRVFNDHDGLDNGFHHAACEGAGCCNRQSGSECEFLHNILQDTPRFVQHAQV